MVGTDTLLDGVRDVVQGSKALLRATWDFHRAAWRLRKVPHPFLTNDAPSEPPPGQ